MFKRFVAGVAVGYVLGARAGEKRYEEMSDLVHKAASSPVVDQLLGRRKDAENGGSRGANGRARASRHNEDRHEGRTALVEEGRRLWRTLRERGRWDSGEERGRDGDAELDADDDEDMGVDDFEDEEVEDDELEDDEVEDDEVEDDEVEDDEVEDDEQDFGTGPAEDEPSGPRGTVTVEPDEEDELDLADHRRGRREVRGRRPATVAHARSRGGGR